MFLPPMKKVTSSINLVVTVGLRGKNISKVSCKNPSACSENLEKLVWWSFGETNEKILLGDWAKFVGQSGVC